MNQERGAEKEKRLAEELLQKKLEEERARVPKAHPYPYTTDYPVVCIHLQWIKSLTVFIQL